MNNPFDPNHFTSLSELVPDLGQEIDKQYPHIAEKILAMWGSTECVDYLENLQNYVLDEQRPNSRQGFTAPVMAELTAIHNYHVTQFSELDSAWKRRRDNPWK